ncbi:uncharacterized protein LOC110178717, partial [Drosophila serrata]|uniref:uncharacterized protein LOC110178717 n=1 Tax=Drosophila serrata TaxID=7274 RepID=UPI000A1D36C6
TAAWDLWTAAWELVTAARDPRIFFKPWGAPFTDSSKLIYMIDAVINAPISAPLTQPIYGSFIICIHIYLTLLEYRRTTSIYIPMSSSTAQ